MDNIYDQLTQNLDPGNVPDEVLDQIYAVLAQQGVARVLTALVQVIEGESFTPVIHGEQALLYLAATLRNTRDAFLGSMGYCSLCADKGWLLEDLSDGVKIVRCPQCRSTVRDEAAVNVLQEALRDRGLLK